MNFIFVSNEYSDEKQIKMHPVYNWMFGVNGFITVFSNLRRTKFKNTLGVL